METRFAGGQIDFVRHFAEPCLALIFADRGELTACVSVLRLEAALEDKGFLSCISVFFHWYHLTRVRHL
jgi:hypothetical protein